MKKIFMGLALCLSTALTFAQNGLESVDVEKYYVSNAADNSGSIGTLPVGSVTYRIYANMLPGYKFQALYGVSSHTLLINTSTTFFNNEDRGATTANAIASAQLKNNSVALDSWFSVGAAAAGQLGVMKTEDNGAANLLPIASNPMLKNATAAMGIALNVQDGILAGTPEAVTFVGLTTELDVFDATSQAGNSFSTSNGSVASLNGSVGPTATNRVLIGQFTTDGVFHYELNIQIGTPTGGTQQFVASNPTGAEISIPSMSGTLGAPNAVPTVNITTPANGSNFITGSVVNIAANAADTDGSVTQVEFFVNGVSVGVDATAPYSVNWTSTAGTKSLTAVATDDAGATATSSVVTINIANNQAPTVSVTAPSNAVTGDLVTLNATANDVDGTVSLVEFYVDNVLVGSTAVSPYSFVWTATLGNHTVKARATDNLGLQTTSSNANITVGNNVPPTVSLTSPSTGNLFTAPAVVAFAANAADLDGSVVLVEFLVNSVVVGSDATAPFTYNWTSVVGTAVITARATDNRGAITTSASVTLEIADPNALPYKVLTTKATCLSSTFCLPVTAVATVSNVIGYDVVLAYDKNKVSPTGNISVQNSLINPSYVDVINSIDAVNGLINISLYFNSSAPSNTSFAGTGNVFCVEFSKTAAFTSVDTAVFAINSLQESYFTGVVGKLANSGKFTTYKDSSFNASLRFWNTNTPIRYNAANPTQYLITNIYGNNASCNAPSLTAVQPDVNGNFTYTTDNGLFVNINKDILGTSDVQPVINGADALLARKVLINDVSFIPSVYQMLAMDVNEDGVVSAGDVSQINQRAVLMIPEFRQAWNYSPNGVSNGEPSKDWIFVDSTTIVSNAAYSISATYPANDGVGYSKQRVPVPAFCLPVPVSNIAVCPLIDVATYKGVLVGDINGNFATVVPNNLFRANNTDKVIFDLSHALVANGHIDVPVFVSSLNTVNALDFSLQFNASNLSFNSVIDHTTYMQSLANYNTNDATLRFTSNSFTDYVMGQNLVSVRFNGTSINESDLTSMTAMLNGERVGTEVITVSTGISTLQNDKQVSFYPNPVDRILTILSTEDATGTILNAEGQVVVASFTLNANQNHEITTENIASGVYMIKVANQNFVSFKKLVVKK